MTSPPPGPSGSATLRGALPRATTRGTGLLVAAVALLTIGFWYGYPELAVLGTAAVTAAVIAVAHTVWQPRLRVARVADPDRVPRGDPSTVTLTVTNTSRLRSATLVADDQCGSRTVPVPVLRLRPRRETTATYQVPTDRRGVVPIGPLRVTRRDPLGLAAMTRTQGGTAQVWVYPRIHPLSAVPAGVVRSMDGRLDRVPHGSITFDSLREYVVGDELRRVHWRTTARVGELMVREHLDTSLPRIVVLLDDRAASHPDPETFESACEAAASVVAAAVREDLAITLHLASGRAAGTGGRAITGSRDFLDLLAEATLHSGVELGTAARRLRQQRLGDTLVYLTGPAGREDLGVVGALRGAYPSVVVGVFGAAEPTKAAGGLVVLDAADGAEFAAQWDGVRA
ncbi:MAG: DUF58 domain-containing protein [Micromonosporaceae bacterium]|jgi:uncharacterized protein (DUF58 family)|nr:DUF58 domain-containing protein [Micromonosporaceae bacterium]